ncbi:ester cyclase [Leptospira perolatii]|uniref:Ester cyclase n=1 Tax=Leptospira perolatii TaxID=2023191 RepID=A0A2M9ZSK9_9LEPT|nr:ester cyclase [Leptospira perolatii]PJZ71427.1 ester cyclase [Leptospira perolatii]PJZ74961.1 ester cyclase [Leptospira perolatii]
MDQLLENKKIVIRFNKEVIEDGNSQTFREIFDPDFVNRTAPEGSNGPEGMFNTFNNILRPAFPDLRVEIYDQIAEGDKVTTRKAILGTHKGEIMGIPPTNKNVRIDVIDIVRLRNGKYFEHWGVNTLPSVLAELRNG